MEDNEDRELQKLTEEMRKRAKEIHDKSNALVNMKLAFVLTDRFLWADVMFQFYNVFKTIELELGRLSDDPLIEPLLIEEMYRTARFEKDLEHYLGEDWNHSLKLWEPTVLYIARIRAAVNTSPVLLVSYVHTMYLALFGGGKVIGKAISKAFGLDGKNGVQGLSFENGDEVKQRLITALNSLPLDVGARDAIFEEKKRIFEMNNEIVRNIKPTYQSYRNFSSWLLKYAITIFLIIFIVYRLCRVIWSNLSSRQKVNGK